LWSLINAEISSLREIAVRYKSMSLDPSDLDMNRENLNSQWKLAMLLKHLLLTCFTLFAFTAIETSRTCGQNLPRGDGIDIRAVGEGFCVSNLFQSNMVLQRDKPIRVWGWGTPNAQVTVTFAGHQAISKVSDSREWSVALPAVSANSIPQQMAISDGSATLTLDNILLGDVWILGGQSNMEFELEKVENGQLEIVSANYPELRILTVPYGQGPEKKRGFARLHEWSDWFGRHFRKGDWDICTPEIAGELSAIGYVFARRIHKAANIPIGVIDVSRGGTTVETWTPLAVLRSLGSPPTQAKLANFDQAAAQWDPQVDLQNRIAQHQQWIERQTKDGQPIPDDRREPPRDLRPGPLGDHNFPGHCYAGMIAPLEGLSITGAIFHQGYNNAFEGSVGAEMYRDVFPEMIRAWRAAFQDPELPFGILSLCTEGDPQTQDNYCEKMFNAGIDIRAVHYSTFLKFYNSGDKNIGYASTYDLRRRWYHPQVKIPAGERIARWALATHYGFSRQIEWKPPLLVSLERRDGALLLKLDTEVSNPQDGAIEGFAIAGEDRRFHPANVAYAETGKDDQGRPQFDRKQLLLTSPMVSQPVHYRYGWGRNPLANLQAVGNKDLPFATQKSDDWRMEEVPLGVFDEDSAIPLSRRDSNKIIAALREQDRLRRVREAQMLIEKLEAAER
jgi:sialate O-acetylesterase